ncbi:hypothetical protein [Nonomuraea sp. NEAU-A123]|uniref:hypothetical protein n=1 Tax=Nonomuraea sp. NEAU-A123 TaxID=2839649 RepID=UPI001BE42553|nr:hypothetical protein [Nonomuraea sp. NEAU-A123]MBT2226249.1 hypothetical protein [Nonomuraea sp. NEAU-A123]
MNDLDPPVRPIDPKTAQRIGQNAKAMLLHLTRADELAREAGLNTEDEKPGSFGAFMDQLHTMVLAFDDWATNTALSSDLNRDTYAGTVYRFVDRRCGVLPDHVREEDRD